MNIIANKISLRPATASEIQLASEFGVRGIILASETAFPGKISLYRGVENDGVVESAGWIAAI